MLTIPGIFLKKLSPDGLNLIVRLRKIRDKLILLFKELLNLLIQDNFIKE